MTGVSGAFCVRLARHCAQGAFRPVRLGIGLTVAVLLLSVARARTCAAAPTEIDLASDTAWTARLDDGPPRAIVVPGGGWNSDVQRPPIQVLQGVRDFVLYERPLTIPAEAAGQVIKLRFGAVNYGAEVFLGDQKVGEHHGPLMPFEVDLTGSALPGKEYRLRVKAFHRRHYIHDGKTADVPVGFDFPTGDDEVSQREGRRWFRDWAGQTKFAYGITKSVKLQLLPQVFIKDVFIRTAVSKKQWSGQVWVANATDRPRRLKLSAAFASWNERRWPYPTLPDLEFEAPAGRTVEVDLGPVPWALGPASYWWPNIPFREDYAAELHYLNLTVAEAGRTWQETRHRFGFVEHAEGPFYYTVNGVRVTGFSDATTESQTSYYDSYSRAPAWLPPTGPGTGCPETWRRYLRAGFNCNRICCSLPTEYMMETADETGFMLIPEAPIWGNGVTRFHPVYTPQSIQEMAGYCRNHPSVARYSLANEPREKRDDHWPWRALIDAAAAVDDTRPYVFELEKLGNGRVDGIKTGHAYIMDHYVPIRPVGGFIHGMGEHVWSTDGLEPFAISSQRLRLYDWAYLAPWSWLNFWPNFLEGMNHKLHAWKVNDHADRIDGVDGWNSIPVAAVQKALNPYLVLDREVLMTNPEEMSGVLVTGAKARRSLEVFNGGLAAGHFELKWTVHWDEPGSQSLVEGVGGPFILEAGFHTNRLLEFPVPELPAGVRLRDLYLVLRSFKDGKEAFKEDRLSFAVVDKPLGSLVQFQGTDEDTQGQWQRKYGREGADLIGVENRAPAYAATAWIGDNYYQFEDRTVDRRGLLPFGNPPNDGARTVAVRYGKPVMRLTVDVGDAAHRISLYFLDWPNQGLISDVAVRGPGGLVLDRQSVAEYQGGKYLTWKIRGTVQFIIHNAAIAGAFFDPPEDAK